MVRGPPKDLQCPADLAPFTRTNKRVYLRIIGVGERDHGTEIENPQEASTVSGGTS